MDAATKFRDDVVSKIRSCLISTKGQISLRKLEEDYRMLIGERIPYPKLGFKTLESFVSSVPTLKVVKGPDGQVYVDAKITEKSAHIVEMVMKQKSSAPPKKKIHINRFSVPHKIQQHQGAWRPKTNHNFSAKKAYNNKAPSRINSLINSQFVNSPNKNPNRYSPQNSSFSNGGSNFSSSSPSSSPSPPRTNQNHYQKPSTNNSNMASLPRYSVPSKIVVPPTTAAAFSKQSSSGSTTSSGGSSTECYSPPPTPMATNSVETPAFLPTPPPTPQSPQTQRKTSLSAAARVRLAKLNSNGQINVTVQQEVVPPPPHTNDDQQQSQNHNVTADPLLSTKKRLNRLMMKTAVSEDNDRDSGTSSPTSSTMSLSFQQPSPLPRPPSISVKDFVRGGNPIKDLRNFVDTFKLGDLEVTFTQTQTKKTNVKLFYCKIKVGKHLYSSYPQDCHDKESAENFTAHKALNDLIPKHIKMHSFLISSDEDVMVRIPPMLEKHPNAVWSSQIESNYMEKYSEQLPSNWLQMIDSSPWVSIQKCPGGFVLKYCAPGDVLQKGKKLDVNLDIFDVSVPSNTVNFNENNQLFAVITVAASVNEIWCYQIGIPEYDAFLEMTNNMEAFYETTKNRLHPTNINIGSCYAIKSQYGWVRVKALSEAENNVVHCFLIDCGEELAVAKNELYYLRKEFAVEHAQAFVCRLDGLEELYEASLESEFLQKLVAKTVILELVEEESPDFNKISILVSMYDIDNGNSLNDKLIEALTLETAAPTLDKNGITRVYVTSIEPNGDIYVQVYGPSLTRFQEMMEALQKILEEGRFASENLLNVVTKENCNMEKLYLHQSKSGGPWRRVQFLDWAPNGEYAQIYHVDFGNTQIVHTRTDKMYPLEQLDDVLSRYPAQALKVRMMIEQIPTNFLEMTSKHMPPDQAVVLKIISHDNEKVAWVEFFTRNSDGGLFCVNKSIAVEAELENIDNTNNNDESKQSRRLLFDLMQLEAGTRNVPSGGVLKKPTLPEKGEYFNVNIPFAVNPWNFFVQPLVTFDQLTALMEELQAVYKDAQNPCSTIDEVIPGHIYASQHDDGRWYRTSVLKVIHSGSISVFYCDFGYYTNLTLSQLIPLDAKFLALPYQALKAKISGIKPKKDKWTVDDCEVFKNLVTKKQFVSVFVDAERDELYKSDFILKLLLIDTSSQDDIYIRDELVNLGIATNI